MKVESKPAEKAAEKVTAGKNLQAEIVHASFFGGDDDALTRFAVKITNPENKTRVGATAEWRALDKDGVLVGTHTKELPPIPAKGTWYYVGGAGSVLLTGLPAKIQLEITNNGSLVSGGNKSVVTVEKAEFKKSEYDLTPGQKEYDVTAVIAVHSEVKTENINTSVLLLDKKGKVVGADWLDLDSLPEQLKAGEKVRVQATVYLSESANTPKEIKAFVTAAN